MTDVRLWPDTPVLRDYLAAASANHPGHTHIDLAVWYSILQNYANRHCMTFGRRAFRVHFLLIAPSGFGKSPALDFGYQHFLGQYHKEMQIQDNHFLYLGGQNTAAGLTDTFNHASDTHRRQVATAWVHETVHLLGGGGRFQGDIVTFFANILNGVANVRRVREKTFAGSDTVPFPVVNACFPATPEQYGTLMKSSSSGLLKQFLLVAPIERDRDEPDFDFDQSREEVAMRSFEQWLNNMEMHKGHPKDAAKIGITPDAQKLLSSRFNEKKAASERERAFYGGKKETILLLAALNALARCKFDVSEEDSECAWNFVAQAYDQQQRLVNLDEDAAPLSASQKLRTNLVKKMLENIEHAGRKGITRDEITRHIYALKHSLNTLERDELFGHLEQEMSDDVFTLSVVEEKADGRRITRKLYFSTKVWTLQHAAQLLNVAPPTWSSSQGGFVDAVGNVHQQVADCIGYRPAWDAITKGPTALN